MAPMALWLTAFATTLGTCQVPAPAPIPNCQAIRIDRDKTAQTQDRSSFWTWDSGQGCDTMRVMTLGVDSTECAACRPVAVFQTIDPNAPSHSDRKILRLAYSRDESCVDGIPLSYTVDVLSYIFEVGEGTLDIVASAVTNMYP